MPYDRQLLAYVGTPADNPRNTLNGGVCHTALEVPGRKVAIGTVDIAKGSRLENKEFDVWLGYALRCNRHPLNAFQLSI
jgi:hypothetical protein